MATSSVSAKTYVRTYIGLLLLTLLTVLIGYAPLGSAHMFVAISIAVAKATLIALFFMHVLVETRLVKLMVVGGIVWFVILISLTLGDYMTRGWLR
jgi:cytochrome c oxidase subunit IV